MSENDALPLKSFSAKVMLKNIGLVKTIIQRIRQKEGGIGSDEDELSLHRMIQDLDLLVDIVDGLKASYDELQSKFDIAAATAMTLQNQNQGMKALYEKMVEERNDRIKELETKLGTRPKKRKKSKE
jgi:hypothetical protein